MTEATAPAPMALITFWPMAAMPLVKTGSQGMLTRVRDQFLFYWLLFVLFIVFSVYGQFSRVRSTTSLKARVSNPRTAASCNLETSF